MPNTRATTISSELFTQFGRTSSEKSIPDVTAEKLLPKGQEVEEEEETITADKYQLNRTALRNSLQALKTYAHANINDLDVASSEIFQTVVRAMSVVEEVQPLYEHVLADVRSVFNDIGTPKTGTVGGFFMGCFTNDTFPGPKGCSPRCASALQPAQDTPDFAKCEDLTLIYRDGAFLSLNQNKSTHAYVYIEDEKFQSFTAGNIRTLREEGIQKITMIHGNSDGSYREVSSRLGLEQLPVSSAAVTTQSNGDTSDTNEDNTAAIVILVILIIIIVILLLALAARYAGWY